MPIDSARAKSLFLTASDLADAAERAAYLDRECGGDTELRARVEALLRVNDAEPTSSQGEDGADDYDDPTARVGSIIAGKYKLIEAIGEGGMGRVFLAHQTAPVKRAVAVKVLKAGIDAQEVLARFELERQALAMMDHPNIARTLDAGVTESGRPFFVTDLFRGTPITQFCDDYKLTPRQRLELFVPVCQAIQHAHLKGVIHRDIKPSNVLVALLDNQPTPMVVDFGIAKAIGLTLKETNLTVGTAEYMSPEQATPDNLDVDSRTDVYSLGALLYELLTGSTPVDRKSLGDPPLEEILRIVRDDDVAKPSARLRASDSLPSVAADRSTEPAKLSKLMKGDLDCLVLKALEKDRTSRYETANELARDIERYLADEVVEARLPSTMYWLMKFVRRHKGPVIAASLALLALVGAVVRTSSGLAHDKAAVAAEKAANDQTKKRLAQFETGVELFAGMLDGINPRSEEKEGKPLSKLLRERAEKAADQLHGRAPGDPLAQVRLQTILGKCLRDLGSYTKAIGELERARTTAERELGADHPDTLVTLNELASGYLTIGRTADAITLLERVRDAGMQKSAAHGPNDLVMLSNLAKAYQVAGRTTDAIALHEQARKDRVKRLGADHADTLATLANLALAYQASGRTADAIVLLEQVRNAQVKKLGADHVDTLTTVNNLAAAYLAVGRTADAIALLEQVRDVQVKKLGAEHSDTLLTLANLAAAYQKAGQSVKAVPLVERARDVSEKKLGADHPDAIAYLNILAREYKDAGKLSEASTILEQVRNAQEKSLGVDHPSTLATMNNLAFISKSSGRLRDAIALYEQVHAAQVKTLGADHADTLKTLNNLAAAYQAIDKHSEAIALHERVYDAKVKTLGAEHPSTLTTLNNFAGAYERIGKLDQALPLFESAAAGVEKRRFQHEHATGIIANTINAFEHAKQFDRAEVWRRKRLALVKEKSGVDSIAYAGELSELGSNLLAQKKWPEGESSLKESLAILEKKEPGDWRTFNVQSLLGGAFLGRKKYADAEPLLLKGYDGMKQREKTIPQEGSKRIPEALDKLIELYTASNKPDEAKKWKAERAKRSTSLAN